MPQVQAVNSITRKKQVVPSHWVGATDKDGKPRRFGGALFTKTPRQKAREKAAEATHTPRSDGDNTEKEK